MNRTKEQWAAARGIPQAAICDEAQQDIAELHARIEGLEAEVARLKSINIQRIDECLSLARERDALRAQVEVISNKYESIKQLQQLKAIERGQPK